MAAQGISKFLVVARGKENRYQTKALVGTGDDFLDRGVTLGDEVAVEAGTYLEGPVGVPPRTRISKGL